MRGMGKVSASSLGSAAHHEAMERMHGNIGEHHEEEARRYPEGSRGHQFHSAVSDSHYYAADEHFMNKHKTVATKGENIISAMTQRSGDGTLPTYHGNLSGKYN